MDTILKHSFISKKLSDRISFRTFLLSALFAALLVLVIVAGTHFSLRRTLVSQKEFELFSLASEFTSEYSDNKTSDNTMISPHIKRRFIVADQNFRITYDSLDTNNLEGKTFFHPISRTPLRGSTFFECDFLSDSIESRISVPIKKGGMIEGCLILLESDSSHNLIFDALGIVLMLSSFITVALFICLAAFAATLLKKRLSGLLSSIKGARTEFSANELHIDIHDETTPLVDEFNNIYEQVNYVQQMHKAFVSDASHELRTPLAAIRLLCESITGTENIDPETTQEFMGDILLEIDRMSHTADKLLVLSRLDSSDAAQLAPVHLTDIVKRTIVALSPLADDKGVKIESYLEDNCIILADTEGATQIISNLIDNAIKYNHEGGCLRIYLYSKNGFCVFITDDTGIGIPEQYREQVFDRFFRIDKSRKHDGRGGSGLGLAIVKQNILRFSGSIQISDSVFGGARFTVSLPKLETSEEEKQ